MGFRPNTLVWLTLVLLICGCLPGCVSIGPKAVPRDNLAYNDALGSAWNSQMLLNMVKLRYGEAPVFVNVASMINQYSLEGQVSINAPGWDNPSLGSAAGATGKWTDRPTITYTPVTGVDFTRSLLTPIQPVSLLGLVQSGWPAEFVFGMAVRSINGIANGTLAPLLQQDPDPRFGELLKAITAVQKSSAIDVRIDRRPDGDVAVLVLQHGDIDDVAGARRTVRKTLGLNEDASEFMLEYGSLANRPNAIAMLTRSLLEIIGEFSFGIDVPEEHLAAGRAQRVQEFTGSWVPPDIPIKSGSDKPSAEEAFVAVPHRGYWYWIEDTNFRAKRVFSFLLLLTSLAETGTAPSAPLITVGTGG